MKNKLLIISTFLIMFLASNVAYAAYNCTTSTPNGTTVYMICHSSEPLSGAQIASLNQAADNHSASRWGNASAKYNCHSYAWWWTSSSNYAWMNTPNDDKYWNDGSYSYASSWSSSTRISYVYGDHSGRNYPGYSGWIYSKWGQWPRMIHWYTDCPYNSSTVRLYN